MKKKRALHEEEMARTADIIKRLPIELARELSTRQLLRAYSIKLSHAAISPIRTQILEARRDEQPTRAREVVTAQRTLEHIARIASKTEPVLGADEKLAEHDAVVMIVRELRSYDEAIVNRNIRRVLPKQTVEVKER